MLKPTQITSITSDGIDGPHYPNGDPADGTCGNFYDSGDGA